jgi:hypothetical protein
MFAEVFFVEQWDPELTGRRIEDRVLKGEAIPLPHLRAWRVAREEVLINSLGVGTPHYRTLLRIQSRNDR